VVRIFTVLGAQGVARHAGAYLARRVHPGPAAFPVAGPRWLTAVAVDGKALLIGPKTNEIPEFAPLLRELDGYYCLAGQVITADAGHTVKAHARFICGELLAHFVFTVKQNTPALWAELDALDWASVPVQHAPRRKGTGAASAAPSR
jgi:hypothetical protein